MRHGQPPSCCVSLAIVSRRWAETKPMRSSQTDPRRTAACELRFQSLFNAGYSYAFPCDAAGKVDLSSLSSKARENYFHARTLTGREFAHPTVRILSPGPATDHDQTSWLTSSALRFACLRNG